jgi:hypothetical protein
MSLFISASGGGNFPERKPLEAGAYAAVCDMVVDLGVQASPGGQFAPKRTVVLRFQIPEIRVEITKDGETKSLPAVISRTVGLSLNEKSTLYGLLTSWRGKAFTADELKKFDLGKVAGKPAFINVTHSVKGDRTYANLTSIMPLPKGMPAPVLEGEALIYSTDAPDAAVFDQLPPWVQDKIAGRIIDAPKAAPAAKAAAPVVEPITIDFKDDALTF